MTDFVRGDCHKCKYETTAECVPRSQKMGFPHCYQSTTTNYDRLRAKSMEEMAEKIGESIDCEVCKTMHHSESGECPCRPHQSCVDFWLDWLKQEVDDGTHT